MSFRRSKSPGLRRTAVLGRTFSCIVVNVLLLVSGCTAQSPATQPAGPQTSQQQLDIRLPLRPRSLRFAVIGDSGTGDRNQYEVAKELEAYHQAVGFDFVIMLGDNIYGGHKPEDFAEKFEKPYKPLLDAGVKFYASLGNHDDADVERQYKPFNMGGERYHTFRKKDVTFFALDSNYMDPKQLQWLESNLATADAKWKICYFHHPLYNAGKAHGPDLDLRTQLMPLFERYGVNVVFSGHEHIYERMKSEEGIYFFVGGNSAKLSKHDLRRSDQVEVSDDRDHGFMLVEISGDDLYFQEINQDGRTVDSGTLARQQSEPKTPVTTAR